LEEKETLDPIEVPMDSLPKESLEGIIKDFILREGTDYGDTDYSLEDKIKQVKDAITNKKAHIFFDPNSETCTIISKQHS